MYTLVGILVSYISGAIFDGLVLLLTLYRAGRLALRSKRQDVKGSLSITLVRDGRYIGSLLCVR